MKRLPWKVLPVLVAGAFAVMFAHGVAADNGERAGESHLSYVPSGGELVVSVDSGSLMALPPVRKAMEDMARRQMPGLLEGLEKYGVGLEPHEVFRRIVFCGYDLNWRFGPDPDRVAVLVHTALPESRFRDVMDELAAQEDVAYELQRFADHDVYLFDGPGDTPAIAYIGPEHVLLADEDEIARALGRLDAGDTLAASPHPRMAGIDTDSRVWMVVEGVDDEVRGADFALDLIGPDSDGVRAHFTVEFAGEQQARAMYGEAREGFDELRAMLEDTGFEPDLAERMSDAVSLDLIGREVRFRLSLDSGLDEIAGAWQRAMEARVQVAAQQSGEMEVRVALGMLRSFQRMHFAEHGTYADAMDDLSVTEEHFMHMQHVSLDEFSIIRGDDDGFLVMWEGRIAGYEHGRALIDESGEIYHGADNDPDRQ